MRFATFINYVVNGIVKNEQCYQKMRAFARDSFRDGWEIWLQCESFSSLPESRQYTYSRGDTYPVHGEDKKCDFLLTRNEMKLWIELKVLLQQNMISLIDRFVSDLNKIKGIDLPYKENSVGAFAVIPQDAAVTFSTLIKDRFRANSKVDISKIEFIAAKPGVADIKGTYDSNPTIDSDRVLILYYVGV